MTAIIDLLTRWAASGDGRRWMIQSACSLPTVRPDQIVIHLKEKEWQIRRVFSREILLTAGMDVLQMETAAMMERMAFEMRAGGGVGSESGMRVRE